MARSIRQGPKRLWAAWRDKTNKGVVVQGFSDSFLREGSGPEEIEFTAEVRMDSEMKDSQKTNFTILKGAKSHADAERMALEKASGKEI